MSYDLDHCRICKRELSDTMRQWAHRRVEEMTCSSECNQRDILRRFACCDKATFLKRACVCMYAFECPVHGERHIGTHD